MEKLYLGMEFGSTRIKAVLIDEKATAIAVGTHSWENQLVDGVWSYALPDVINGMQSCYASLKAAYNKATGKKLTKLTGIGISAMMHGYLAFNKAGELLVPFRTWRNTMTEKAADELTEKLGHPIPQRWTSAHFYQAVLSNEPHLKELDYVCTLESYVHELLSGKRVVGAGEASGMFPIENGDFDPEKLEIFDRLLREHGWSRPFKELVPTVMTAGMNAGYLTEAGARLLDVSGELLPGAPMCPPEGDVQTGMIATGSVRPGTGNLSAGTSSFANIITGEQIPTSGSMINKICSPSGKHSVMIHINNFTCDLNDWSNLFGEVAELCGASIDKGELMTKLFNLSEHGDGSDGLAVYNTLSGEPILGLNEGRRIIARTPENRLNLASFMQTLIFSAIAGLSKGFALLRKKGVKIDSLCGHGGFFKTERIGAEAMASAFSTPITVWKTAGEGGAWGIAVLALYLDNTAITFEDFIDKTFAGQEKSVYTPKAELKEKFDKFMTLYDLAFAIEKAAVESI